MRSFTNINHLAVLVAVFSTVMMVSCFKDEVVCKPGVQIESQTICFDAEAQWMDEGNATRGGAMRNRVGMLTVSSADGSHSLPVGIYEQEGIHTAECAETRGSKLDGGSSITSFMAWASMTGVSETSLLFPAQGVEFSKNANNIFESDPQYFWPGAGTIDFVAIANAPASGITPNLNSTGTAVESFTYTVPTAAEDQKDIVVATALDVDGGLNASVPLTFKHVMTAVNFRVGSQMANGKIKSITLNNIYSKAAYNLENGTWGTPVGDSKKSFTVNFSETTSDGMYEPNGKEGTDIDINGGEYTFMMLPQVLPDDAELVVEFVYDNNSNVVTTLRANIAKKIVEGEVNAGNYEWKKNKTVYYTISVDENFNLTITPMGDILDAHYVMTDITVNVDTPNDQAWTLEVSATNIEGDDVSVEFKDNLNKLIREDGYWVNNIIEGNTKTSARGSKTLQGTKKGAYTITVFIPENVTAQERQITLKLYLNNEPDKTKFEYLYQKYPYWDNAKGFGWERVENSEVGEYGFTFDRVVCYIFNHSFGTSLSSEYDYFNDSVDELIALYNASNYVFKRYYEQGTLSYRGAVIIDYGKFPQSDVYHFFDTDNGFSNTQGFFDFADALAFETALKSVVKRTNNSEYAFRIALDGTEYEGAAVDVNKKLKEWGTWSKPDTPYLDSQGVNHTVTWKASETMDDMSGILNYIIKRNAFDLKKVTSSDYVYYTIDMNKNNIKWYLPAVNQYKEPVLSFATGNSTFISSQYWSSTAKESDVTKAYLGSGDIELKSVRKKVVVQRIPETGEIPTAVTIDNTSMQGGDNGEAQWVD